MEQWTTSEIVRMAVLLLSLGGTNDTCIIYKTNPNANSKDYKKRDLHCVTWSYLDLPHLCHIQEEWRERAPCGETKHSLQVVGAVNVLLKSYPFTTWSGGRNINLSSVSSG